MTLKITISRSSPQFSQLLEPILRGEEILLCEEGEEEIPIARVIPTGRKRHPRQPGQDRGKIFIAPDFNAPLPDDILADFTG